MNYNNGTDNTQERNMNFFRDRHPTSQSRSNYNGNTQFGQTNLSNDIDIDISMNSMNNYNHNNIESSVNVNRSQTGVTSLFDKINLSSQRSKFENKLNNSNNNSQMSSMNNSDFKHNYNENKGIKISIKILILTIKILILNTGIQHV